jgi:predicted alpha/beta hydrolase family esterase
MAFLCSAAACVAEYSFLLLTAVSTMILNIPGLRNSGPGHWQSLWEQQYPAQFLRVEQENWHEPEREAWVVRLAAVVQQYAPEELILVGHSVGCATIVHAVRQWG